MNIKTNTMNKLAYYNTHDLDMPSFRMLTNNPEVGDHAIVINKHGNQMFVATIRRVNRKGLQMTTSMIAPTPLTFHLPFSQYHALSGNDHSQDAYIKKRLERLRELQ